MGALVTTDEATREEAAPDPDDPVADWAGVRGELVRSVADDGEIECRRLPE
jgi:hypothetical protein